MFQDNLRYDPVRDLTPVSNVGFIDLQKAYLNNAVPSVVEGADTDYNGIDDPASILGKPHDVFEALEMESSINGFTASVTDNKDDGQ